MKRLETLLLMAATTLLPVKSQAVTVEFSVVAAAEKRFLKDWDGKTFIEYVGDSTPMGGGADVTIILGEDTDEDDGVDNSGREQLNFTYFNTDIAKSYVPPLKIDGGRFHEIFQRNEIHEIEGNIAELLGIDGVVIQEHDKLEIEGDWEVNGEGFRFRYGREMLHSRGSRGTSKLLFFVDYFGMNANASAKGKVTATTNINVGMFPFYEEVIIPFDFQTEIKARGFSMGLRPEVEIDVLKGFNIIAGAGFEFKNYSIDYRFFSNDRPVDLPYGLNIGSGYETIKVTHLIGAKFRNAHVTLEKNSVVAMLLKVGFSKEF